MNSELQTLSTQQNKWGEIENRTMIVHYSTACSHQENVQCRCFVTSNTILPILRLFRHSFRHQILNVIMCSLQVIADFLSCVVNFWPGDDFLGDSSAKTSIFPYNFLERQSCRDPYLSIRNSRRVGLGQTPPWFSSGRRRDPLPSGAGGSEDWD